jgi:calcineurin-like phosphoesterase family protein
MIYFTSDTHFAHRNICRGTTSWKELEPGSNYQNTRDFNTLEEMNYILIKGINDYVAPDDELWHLGDWSFGGFANIRKFREQLVCQNIHLIYGNHDHYIERNKDNIQDIFKSVQHYKELVIDGQMIVLSHYSMRVWNKSHKGSIHLYGHSHGSILDYGKSMDVGVDAVFKFTKEYRPLSWKEIEKIMSGYQIQIVDHHNSKTN